MNFDQAIVFILKYEGGYSNDPLDKGGETKYGISKRAHPTVDIKNLSLEDAKKIYKRDYWIAPRVDLLCPEIRLPLFDACVNHGRGYSVKALQKILKVKIDGNIGSRTKFACKEYDNKKLLVHNFLSARLRKYLAISSFDVYGYGWCRRLLDVAVNNK